MRVGPVLGGLATIATTATALAFGPRTQAFGRFPYRGDSDAKLVALSFDDGPNEPWTSRLLDVLDGREVTATFFQVGRCVERFPDTTRRIVQTGHVLGNHSLSHAFSRYLTQPRQHTEIGEAEDIIHGVSGVRPTLYRPPWLCHWPWVLRSVETAGLQVVSGTFAHPLEVAQPPADRLVSGAVGRTSPGAILILHDGREARGGPRDQTVAAVGGIIDRLRAQGYRFVTVDRLLGVPAYQRVVPS